MQIYVVPSIGVRHREKNYYPPPVFAMYFENKGGGGVKWSKGNFSKLPKKETRLGKKKVGISGF